MSRICAREGGRERQFELHLHAFFSECHRNQSGTYFCNVTIIIPCVVRESGSGTSLTVEVLTSGKVSETSLAVVWTSLLAAVLAVGIGCAIYCKRKGNIRTATTGQETDCPTPDHSDVLYAKLNVREFQHSRRKQQRSSTVL
ncbi:hypothetical protein SKAU_G00002190 [Synaphobranchus kaupii]|uniref:Uncharacterized protein n=1 Tax=Synaphobranchus kaupii TaxID=118154 RepID=A0A9Q1G8E8_SYNKA|nr:hypothetical protein SKAU_G00002190 [Synaphobranchus kaupii]